MPPRKSPDELPCLAISVDYGTTNTSVAWSINPGLTADLLDINIVTEWGSHSSPTVPSLCSYSPDSKFHWGFGVSDTSQAMRWTKLDLEEKTKPAALAELRRLVQQTHPSTLEVNGHYPKGIPFQLTKNPTQALTDFLTQVANQVFQDVTFKVDSQVLKNRVLDLTITHPQEWSGRDNLAIKRLTRATSEAFHKAFSGILAGNESGLCIRNVRLSSDLEASFYLMIRSMLDQGQNFLAPGDLCTVVDAGGVFTKATTLRVLQLSPHVMFEPVGKFNSSPCGSQLVDHTFFLGYLFKKLGQGYDKLAMELIENQNGPLAEFESHDKLKVMAERFQLIKHQFSGSKGSTQDFVLGLISGLGDSGQPPKGAENGQLRISKLDLEAIFAPAVEGVIDIILNQFQELQSENKSPKVVLMTGGFSNNEYLRQCLIDFSYSWLKPFWLVRAKDIGCLESVAQGGILLGSGANFWERYRAPRLSEHHVGIVVDENWVEGHHHPSQKYHDEPNATMKAKNNIKWLVSMGDAHLGAVLRKELTIRTPVLHYHKYFRVIQVIFSREKPFSDLPPRMTDNPTGSIQVKNLEYAVNQTVLNSAIKSTTPDGAQCHLVDLRLKMEVTSKRATFELMSTDERPTRLGSLEHKF